MIEYTTIGTSHSKCMGGTIYNLPKGYHIDVNLIIEQLKLRQCGIGRSDRQLIEHNQLTILSGLDKKGNTTGKSLTYVVPNGDSCLDDKPPITALRGGHADYPGCVKYNLKNARQIAELSSGRNTLHHVVAGAICQQILSAHHIDVVGYTKNIGGIVAEDNVIDGQAITQEVLHCPDTCASIRMQQLIQQCRESGDSIGGVVGVLAYNVPIGLGQITPYDKRIQSVISAYLMGIPSVKGIQFGLGFDFADKQGSQCSDGLELLGNTIKYTSNNCGGIVGGLCNGQPIRLYLAVKPIPTIKIPTRTVDIKSMSMVDAHYERSDVCVVPNIAVIAQNMLCTSLCSIMNEENRL
ncbi:MAG: chorismate synthase [Clostridia bacterium]|nr:chorismate synthase [Clostridia bacterium]